VSVPRLILGTRGSRLALWQARRVALRLRTAHPALVIEERVVETDGDIESERALGPDDRGAFVRRIERALLAREIDLAVHSLKDLPTTQPAGLILGAVPERHDPRDALLSRQGWEPATLPARARVATSSPRRRTQLLHARPDLRIVAVRGNVDTRVRRLVEDERFDALVLALAGVERLGIDTVAVRPIDTSLCLPAAGQGALAVEVREDDARTRHLVAALDDPAARLEVQTERAFLQRLGGGCLAPATGFARLASGELRLEGRVGALDGGRLLIDHEHGAPQAAAEIAERLAARMLGAGAGELLREARDRAGAP
jgi:hydroxymethylbilane synthase